MQNLFLRGYAGLQAGGAAPLHLQEGQGRVGQPATKEESLYDSRHNWEISSAKRTQKIV